VSYAVDLNYFVCTAGPNATPDTCSSPGTVTLNGQTFIQNTEIYVSAGGNLAAAAYPNSGFIFGGWLPVPGSGNTSQAFLNSWIVNGPMILYPIFKPARPIGVSIQTSPVGLEVLVDRTPTYSPINLEWGMGTTHQVGGISPQYDLHGNLWVFNSWSDGGAYSHAYTVPGGSPQALSLTATYVTGTMVTFLTNPAGLALNVDGQQDFSDYTFAWAPGSSHTVTAPATAVDGSGNMWSFQSWSNNGPETQQITVSTNPGNNRYTATYQPAGSLNINSNLPGVPMQVDGQPCPTPCSVGKAVGTKVQVTAPVSASGGPGAQLDFKGWSDGAPASRAVTVMPKPTNLNAAYKLRYQLLTVSDPPNGVIWDTQPASPDSFFDVQTPVMIAVETKPGYQFLNWAGDASGEQPSVQVTMDGPHTVRAELNPVPYISPGGIQNSAAPTPKNEVAPGSAIAVYGVNLASAVNSAPASRLVQTLESVSVRAGGQLLPLFFVSPGQINAQLSSNLSEGQQTLTVHVEGKPDANAYFTVVRNAPGLFSRTTDSGAFAVATHQDGSAISTESPARRGEVVALYGTGLGPYNPSPADGVAVPAGQKYPLADPAVVVMGDHQAKPVWAGAASGRIGVAVVQMKIDDSIPHSTNLSLNVKINGVNSNAVLLPVE
jgi:uncharacterized protein (TIGR03437 family)